MHLPALYKCFHKQHHEFIEPYGWTGIYCSPAELLFVNVLSVSVGPILTGMTGWPLCAWVITISVLTVLSHSGIILPIVSDGKHDIHHQKFSYNYGIFEYLDRWHGTLYIPKIV